MATINEVASSQMVCLYRLIHVPRSVMRPANERRCYIVTTSLIGWALHVYTCHVFMDLLQLHCSCDGDYITWLKRCNTSCSFQQFLIQPSTCFRSHVRFSNSWFNHPLVSDHKWHNRKQESNRLEFDVCTHIMERICYEEAEIWLIFVVTSVHSHNVYFSFPGEFN